jgi:ATP/maltotriose-dependent transcriptional regulator MalT
VDSERLLAMAQMNLAKVSLVEGDPESAAALAREAREHARLAGDAAEQSMAAIIASQVEVAAGRYQAAFPLMDESLQLARTSENPVRLIDALTNISVHYALTDQMPQALASLDEALEVAEPFGRAFDTSTTYLQKCTYQVMMGDHGRDQQSKFAFCLGPSTGLRRVDVGGRKFLR